MVIFKIPELFLTFITGDYDRIEEILKSGIDLECIWNDSTPLTYALKIGDPNIVALLVKYGVDVNRRFSDYRNFLEPPLVAACRMNDIYSVRELLKSPRININQRNFMGRTGLYFSALNYNVELVKLLLGSGVRIRLHTKTWNDPFYACAFGARGMCQSGRTIVQMLIASGYRPTQVVLKEAMRTRDKEIFKLIIEAGYQMQNEKFLRKKWVRRTWPEDEKFCSWIMKSKKRPLKLQTISLAYVREILFKRWGIVRAEHVLQLPLTSVLIKKLLLN